jgi:subtilisin-like proprotein convertase family protein
MAAVNYNFTIEQGSNFEVSYQYNDTNGNGIDLTDKCVLLRWIQNDNNGQNFSSQSNSSLDPQNGGYTLNGNNLGRITLNISSERTKNYTFNTAVYDLDIIENINNIPKNTRIATGTIVLFKRNFEVVTDCAALLSDPDVVASTPTPTSPGVTPTPTPIADIDLCLPEDCLELDIYSVVYTGSSLSIPDNSIVSGYISTTDTRNITNIELAINGLRHSSPQDLSMLLAPPSGDKILLSSNNKITNYSNGFSYMFSNKAIAGSYINNTDNGGLCNILDKTDIVNYNNENLYSSFNHLFNTSTTGNWNLIVKDSDIGVSGSIDSWKLIITYEPSP